MSSAKAWAKRNLLAELRELGLIGFACNVQDWGPAGVKTNVETCKARRRAANRLLRVAIAAVEAAS